MKGLFSKKKILTSLILLLTSISARCDVLVSTGMTLPILGNKEHVQPTLSIGYAPHLFQSPISLIYTKVTGEERTSIFALNFYFKPLTKRFFFLPGFGYMTRKTSYLNSHFQFYWTFGYRLTHHTYIAFKHISNGSKIFSFMSRPNLGENIYVIGHTFSNESLF